MKKHFLLSLFCLACASVAFVLFFVHYKDKETDVAAEISGKEIYSSQIEQRILYSKIRNKAYTETINDAHSDKSTVEALLAKVICPTEYEDVLQEMIKAEVIRQYLNERDSLVDYEQCKESVLSEFELMKTDGSQETFYNALKNSLEYFQTDEAQYLELSCDFAYDFYNNEVAKSIFKNSDLYEESSETTLDVQYDNFVNDLVEKASVRLEDGVAIDEDSQP